MSLKRMPTISFLSNSTTCCIVRTLKHSRISLRILGLVREIQRFFDYPLTDERLLAVAYWNPFCAGTLLTYIASNVKWNMQVERFVDDLSATTAHEEELLSWDLIALGYCLLDFVRCRSDRLEWVAGCCGKHRGEPHEGISI